MYEVSYEGEVVYVCGDYDEAVAYVEDNLGVWDPDAERKKFKIEKV